MDQLLSTDDHKYINNKSIDNLKCRINLLYFILAINTIFLIFISITVMYYIPSINTIVHLVNKHKHQVNSTIYKISVVADKVDTISTTILNFKSIAKNKLLVSLCGNYVTHAILGSYFCPNNTTTSNIHVDLL